MHGKEKKPIVTSLSYYSSSSMQHTLYQHYHPLLCKYSIVLFGKDVFRQIFFEIVERQVLRRNYSVPYGTTIQYSYLLFIPFIHNLKSQCVLMSNHQLTGSVQLNDEMNLKILSQVSVCVRISCRIYGTDALGVESCFIFPDCCRIDALPFD